MRQRLRSLRARPMARRPGQSAAFELSDLSPRARGIGGWVAAAVLIGGIAIIVGLLGGDRDGPSVAATPSASSGPLTAPITFGTALDPETGEVAEGARVDRFATGDLFVYSVAPVGTVPAAVYVEVRRSDAGAEVVQSPVDAQPLPDPRAIAFRVPTDDLLAGFGPGEYLMLIYMHPTADPIAEGTFRLVGPNAGASIAPSG